ncbi:ZIP family metal transporter [Microvirga lenta]|uniref:ZIP family metal transporter n=1 Tax=Microvirga lenta TaxID=2881337 RepID=UPI001CFFB61A|nr:peptidoglycan-binding protein [Microvirga lenta]MCB5177549.1 peptidoglycan-binding protein [Microvirga lenta]
MDPYLQVLALALLPALGNFAGGAVAELIKTSRRTLSRALHVAAGIVVAVVAIELMPEALEGAAPWLVVLGFCLGGVTFILLDWAIERFGGGEEAAGPWIVYGAVFIDLFSDGLMIGVGSVVSLSLALVLAIGQVTADVPEGFATIANFRDKGVERSTRLLLSASFVIAPLLGASIGYWLLRDQSASLQLTALAFTAGLLILAAVEEMLGEAHDVAEDTRFSAAFFIGGFALFTLVSSYFEA